MEFVSMLPQKLSLSKSTVRENNELSPGSGSIVNLSEHDSFRDQAFKKDTRPRGV